MFKAGCHAVLFALLALSSLPAQAAKRIGEFAFTGSGFMTLGVGQMLGGTHGTVLDKTCPCLIADYAQNAIYDGSGGLQFSPDSKLGLQGTMTLPNPNFSVTAQAVARGSLNGNINLEWLYGSYQFSDASTIQIGRKRLPIFYYSDSQDIGFALPWTHLPPQLYGWEAVNYNGISLQQRAQVGDWDVLAGGLLGNEHVTDSGYWQIYNGQASQTNVQWKNIVGANVQLTRDWFETRWSYIQSDTERQNINGVWNNATQRLSASPDAFLHGLRTKQRIYTSAFSVDYADWLVQTELLFIDRPGANFKDHANRLGVTRRLGSWEVSGNIAEYHAQAVIAQGGNPQAQESHINQSLTTRYFLSPQSDVKVQIEQQRDRGGVNWQPKYGNATLLTLAYDRIF
ncbi:MAG: hypothetical protein PXX73_07105 [Sideroxydans sp.]|nr:hypothetical protein [Sideroxydans sp.]